MIRVGEVPGSNPLRPDRESPANTGLEVTVQFWVPGLGERGEGIAAVVGGEEFAQVGE
jgi:hypothetical protein